MSRCWVACCGCALFLACKAPTSTTSGVNAPPSQRWTAPAVGEPAGIPVTATVGVTGGTLSSLDGRLTVTVPAGALAGDTSMTIQPITNVGQGQGSVGPAYRLLPEGQTFLSAVTVSYVYTAEELAGSAPEALGLSYQSAALGR